MQVFAELEPYRKLGVTNKTNTDIKNRKAFT